ncbi:alginate lyase family protein [Haloechinothrix halophila]|uniref:alginate lyase family protein n=1 Tax=Haloechinothrix halophila TaxID=1069073 RepID=UPI00041CCB58|nr:alginate lyase family protein [Haloechinothrix halophila]
MTTPGWYLRRLSAMGPAEIAGRAIDAARKRGWRRIAAHPPAPALLAERRFATPLPHGALDDASDAARYHLLTTAERLFDGHAEYFGAGRDDLVSPDWSVDPKTGRRAPADAYAFDVPYRDEAVIGDIKQIWEPSRHQHLTVLAAAYAVTGESRYAERVADHLKSWWSANPPLRGVHWVSGIELGIRLLSWVWVRRLLDGWAGAADLFERNDVALQQIWHHQRWLAAFPSRGSSANNHAVAEAAGQLAASCAFDWFAESATWRAHAALALDRHLRANTFGSGLNRELATEYHGLVLELGLAAALEADAAGVTLPATTWPVLLRMTDALAAIVDVRLRPPRQGDADDGYGVVLDGDATDRWASLLATGSVLFGRPSWWPETATRDVRTAALTALARTSSPSHPAPLRPLDTPRPASRPDHLADAGLTLLRSPEHETPELWCRCDAGPHGFLAIAAHAHADALSVEVRHDGVDVLADPGTYCYHSEPAWRAYFRSTIGHNTLRLDRTDQSTSGGPFLWTRHARSRVLRADTHGDVARWHGEHDGYARRGRRHRRGATHRRTVTLDRTARRFTITDDVDSARPHHCELAFHLGPTIDADLADSTARLRWTADGTERTATLDLPPELVWSEATGENAPPLGWYSPGFGRKQPTTTLLGTGSTGTPTDPTAPTTFTTVLTFHN